MKAKEQRESLARWAIQNTSEWKSWIEEKQREAWVKHLKEATEAEQQKRDVWVAKQLGKSPGTEKEAEPIHSQVSKKRTPTAKGHDGKEPPAKSEKKDKEPPTKKGSGQGTTSTKGQAEQWRQGTISSR